MISYPKGYRVSTIILWTTTRLTFTDTAFVAVVTFHSGACGAIRVTGVNRFFTAPAFTASFTFFALMAYVCITSGFLAFTWFVAAPVNRTVSTILTNLT